MTRLLKTTACSRLSLNREGALLRVILNRPEARNALDETAMNEITGVFNDVARDKSLRVVVFSANGPDFCAGGDIAWMQRSACLPLAKNKKEAKRLLDMFLAIDEAPFVVVANVRGNCFGAGLGLIGACDIVLADRDSRFAFSEARLGVIPAVVSSFTVPKIGLGQARRLFITGEKFGADFAMGIGLVHILTDSENNEAKIQEIAAGILKTAPQTTALSKQYLRQFEGLSRKSRIEKSMQALAKTRATPQAKEGFAAFLEKRRPDWKN